MKKKSQSELIKNYLLKGGKLTSIQALNKFGCFRLASRINELKSKGFNIESKTISKDGKKYSKYFISVNSIELV